MIVAKNIISISKCSKVWLRVAVAMVLAFCAGLPVFASFDPMSESTVVLPSGSGISWRWVVPPTTMARPIPKHTVSELKFSVDPAGQPFIGVDKRQILNPAKQLAAVVSEPFQGFTHLDNGLMLLTTVRTLGFIAASNKEEFDGSGLPVLPYQPICDLPSYYSRVYRAAGNAVYLVSEDAAAGKTAIYLLQPEAAVPGKPAELRGYRKIFESGEAISAVAGDDKAVFIAMGKMVLMLTLHDHNLVTLPVQPDEEVRELTYQKGIGLFYATASGVGFLGSKRAFRLIETSHPRIVLRGSSLYVLFPRNLGVMAFDNIDRLWDFDFVLANETE